MAKQMAVCHICKTERLLPKPIDEYVKFPKCDCGGRMIKKPPRKNAIHLYGKY